MASASSLYTAVAVPYLPSPRSGGIFSARFRPTHLNFPRHRLSLSAVASARRRSTESAAPRRKKKRQTSWEDSEEEEEEEDDEDMDGDAFEALFRELEKDLKNDTSVMDDDDDEITEEDFAMVERSLTEALRDDGDEEEEWEEEEEEEDDDYDDDEEEEEEEEEEDEEEEENGEVKLRNWQLRRLATALKVGRRKVGIKHLAAELCLDRAVVLNILRNPPPKLLMFSSTLPDVEPTPIIQVPETKPVETLPATTEVEFETKVNAPLPVHVRQSRWVARKGLKRVQALTLEKVYRRTKRPTNTMVNSIVQVTNLPRKRVVQWFEDKRAEDGIIDKFRTPYKRSAGKNVASQ